MTALGALQAAIYERLAGALSCPVYDDVPEDAALPYVVLGEATSSDQGTKDLRGYEIVEALHVYSGYGGMRETNEIMEAAETALASELTLDGWDVLAYGLELANPVVDEDGTRHGVLRLRIKVLER